MATSQKFESLLQAQTFVSDVIDHPLPTAINTIKPGITLTQQSIDLGNGHFTNSYDLAFDSQDTVADIIAFDRLTSVHAHLSSSGPGRPSVAVSGGFFYLADIGSGAPRQLALNLSISMGNVRSLPVNDQKAVIAGKYGIESRTLAALGAMTIGNEEITWSGSRTSYETEAKVFSNGNTVVFHEPHELTGHARVLYENSRYTPPIFDEDFVDVGYLNQGKNYFKPSQVSTAGKLDIFAHEFVVRCPRRYLSHDTGMQLHTIDDVSLDSFVGGAFSTGPDIFTEDFTAHPINQDASLGSKPPFAAVRMGRMALYQSAAGINHIRLFDGRPGSPTFAGVTPDEAVAHIAAEQDIVWGCFLDQGQTAKICTSTPDGGVASYGNRHYMRWPDAENPGFMWVPDSGRPVANVITVQ